MRKVIGSVLLTIACFALLAAAPDEKGSRPQYDEKGSCCGRLTTGNGCSCPPDTA
jgi:hypothetical protein